MDKFRFSIDIGSGYSLIDVYDNTLKLTIKRGVTDMVTSKELTGNISFIGDLAETVFNKRLTSYFLPFKIEEYNGTVWSVLHECNADARGEYNRLSRKITLSSFVEEGGYVSDVLSFLKTKFNLKELISIPSTITYNAESRLLNIFSLPTDVSESIYRTVYTIDNTFNNPNVFDDRFKFFYYVGTTGTSPNLIHEYACQHFDYDPGFIVGFNQILYQGKSVWTKVTNVGDPQVTLNNTYSTNAYQLTDILNRIMISIGFPLTYTRFGMDFLNSDNIYICDTSEILGENIEGLELSLEDIFNFIRINYAADWYMDVFELKFKFNPLAFYDNTIDWTTDTVNTSVIDYSYNPMPDVEVFEFLDKNRFDPLIINNSFSYTFGYSKFKVSYFDRKVVTSNNILNKPSGFYGDVFNIKKNNAESKTPIWINYDAATEVFIINDSKGMYTQGDGINSGGGNIERFSEYTPNYEDNTDKSAPYIPVPSLGAGTRPIYEIKYNKWLNDYSILSLFTRILFNNNNEGILNSYEIDMNTGNAEFYIRFKEINL